MLMIQKSLRQLATAVQHLAKQNLPRISEACPYRFASNSEEVDTDVRMVGGVLPEQHWHTRRRPALAAKRTSVGVGEDV